MPLIDNTAGGVGTSANEGMDTCPPFAKYVAFLRALVLDGDRGLVSGL